MNQFEQGNRETNIEYSPETINFLKQMRKTLIHYLEDYKNEIPDEIISGKTKYKCQNNWFFRLTLLQAIDDKLKENEITNLKELATDLIEEVRKNERNTKEQIKNADKILKAAIKELGKIIGE